MTRHIASMPADQDDHLPLGEKAECPYGLVIVEGIMGSGKSTTMRLIAQRLRDAGQHALPIHERTEPHPVRATDELEHWFEPWRDATPLHLVELALAKWSNFVQDIQAGCQIPVLDGQLFHGDLTNLLLMEAEGEVITRYVQALTKIITPLNPFILYLWQDDVERAIRTICAERGQKWVEYQVHWKLAAPYCTRRNLTGLDGLINLYRDYRALTDQLFQELPVAKLAIENSAREWPTYERNILEALGLQTRRL